MNHPWLTTIDWPVSAFDGKAARNSAASATSWTVVNSPSTVSFSIMVLITSASEIPSSRACSGICFSTSGVRTKPGQITLARTPCAAPSFATTFARPIEAVLGGDVRSLERRRLLGMHGSHVDDAAALLAVHLAQGGAGRQEGAVQVDGKHLLPFVEIELDERRHDLDAGVADQDVEAPEGFDRLRHSAFHLLLVADIHANPERTFAHRIDLGRGFLRRVLIKIRDDHLCSLAGEAERNLLADAARGSGDHRHLVEKPSTGSIGALVR